MTFTKRIGIERYTPEIAKASGCAGLIEGETQDGERWIIFMDVKGKPDIYWPERDEEGGVVGDSISLDPKRHLAVEELRRRKMIEILKDPNPAKVVERLQGALRAAERMAANPETIPSGAVEAWEYQIKRVMRESYGLMPLDKPLDIERAEAGLPPAPQLPD